MWLQLNKLGGDCWDNEDKNRKNRSKTFVWILGTVVCWGILSCRYGCPLARRYKLTGAGSDGYLSHLYSMKEGKCDYQHQEFPVDSEYTFETERGCASNTNSIFKILTIRQPFRTHHWRTLSTHSPDFLNSLGTMQRTKWGAVLRRVLMSLFSCSCCA